MKWWLSFSLNCSNISLVFSLFVPTTGTTICQDTCGLSPSLSLSLSTRPSGTAGALVTAGCQDGVVIRFIDQHGERLRPGVCVCM